MQRGEDRMGNAGSGTLAVAVVVVLLALTTISPVSGDQVTPEEPSEPVEEPWVNKDWDWYMQFYGEARWRYIPGLRLTPHKLHELWDRALEHALLEDDWLGSFSENIKFGELEDYKPAVPGKTFVHVDNDDGRALKEQYGQIDRVHVGGGGTVDITSVTAYVGRHVSLSDARRERHERGCYRGIMLRCSRSWGDWECEPTRRTGSECVDLAHDDLRWTELPDLEMTREKKHALWNRVLQHALARDGWLGRPSGTIALSTDLGRFDERFTTTYPHLGPDYKPAVAGATIELRDPGAIRDLAEEHSQFEYLHLSDYSWYRGPVTVHVAVSRTVAMCQARRSRRESGCYRTELYACRESEDDWTCRVTRQWGDKCDPSRRLTTPCD